MGDLLGPVSGESPKDSLGGCPRDGLGGSPRDGLGGSPRDGLGGSPRDGLGGSPRDGLGGSPRDSLGGSPILRFQLSRELYSYACLRQIITSGSDQPESLLWPLRTFYFPPSV